MRVCVCVREVYDFNSIRPVCVCILVNVVYVSLYLVIIAIIYKCMTRACVYVCWNLQTFYNSVYNRQYGVVLLENSSSTRGKGLQG